MISKWGTIKEDLTLKSKIKQFLMYYIGKFHIYKISEKPIIIFANRRGGSTLIMEMLASQEGTDFIGEPLTLWHFGPFFGCLPHPPLGCFISLSNQEKEILKKFFDALLSGNKRGRNNWNPFRPDYHFFVKRLIVKINCANSIIDFFSEKFDANILYFVRHPFPIALSCMRLGWGNCVQAFLLNDHFCSEIIGEQRAREAWRIWEKGGDFQKYVLEWCLENFYALSQVQKRSWLTITYEELVARTPQVATLLSERFHLPDVDAMKKVINRPSRTSTSESRTEIREQGPCAILERWREKISETDLRQGQDVLDVMNITDYQADLIYPSSRLCHFGPLN